MEEVAKVMLEEATPFQKLHRSLSSSPIFSGPIALLKLVSFFPLFTQYKGNPSMRVGSWSLQQTRTNFPFQSL